MHSTALKVLAAASLGLLFACSDPDTEASGDVDATIEMAEEGGAMTAEAGEPMSPEDSEQLQADLAVIEQACRERPNTDDAVCSCVEGEARELKRAERALAVAQYVGDEPRAAEAREQLDVIGMTTGGSFLVNAPLNCGG